MKKISESQAFDLVAKAPKESHYAFDCDGTLITHDMASHVCWELLRQGLVHQQWIPPEWEKYEDKEFSYNMFLELRNTLGQRLEMEQIFRWEFHTMSGMPASQLIEVSRRVLQREIKEGILKLRPRTCKIARENAHRSFIVSASPDHCVKAVGDELGIPHKQVKASRLKVDDKGLLMPEIAPPGLVWSEAKRKVLEDEEQIKTLWFAAGDSSGDLPLLDWATGIAWCVLIESEVNSLYSLKSHIQHFLLKDKEIPADPGLYLVERGNKNWILEI